MAIQNFTKWVLLLFSLFFIASVAAEAQTSSPALVPPMQLMQEHVNKNNYYSALKLLTENEEAYLSSTFKVAYLESVILLHSYLSNFEEAYRYEEMLLAYFDSFNKLRERYSVDITKSVVDTLKMVPALEAIGKVAPWQQVIMINEEHRTPLHRAFVRQLLPLLYAQGFRYFAAETFTQTDTALAQRGYPTQETGFYTADPVFGNVVREAIGLGYTPVAYEWEETPSEDLSPEEEQDLREKGQAQNLISRILRTEPAAKILVFAGRAHVAKASLPEFSFMAWHFQQLSGIMPYTIDQVQLGERFIEADENPLYRYIISNKMPAEPITFATGGGNYWSGSSSYDMQILHPRTTYTKGRPDWLWKVENLNPVPIRLRKLKLSSDKELFTGKAPVVIEARKTNETTGAIPLDQVMLLPGKKIPVLLLPKGSFQVLVKNENGNVLMRYQEKIH